MPVKMIGLAELETDMAEIINRALTDCQTLTDDIRTVIQKEIERKTNSHSYSDSQMITVPDDSMLPRLEALAILEAEKFADGAERVVLKNVSFDDLTVADWKVGTKGNITAPFTFTKYEFLDTIEAV